VKRIFILFMAGIVFCVCSASVIKNPAGLIANQKAHDYYDRKDYKSAFINYQKASELGIPEAQYYLANMYLEGKGSKKNKTEAIMWIEKSANGGFAMAQVSMGFRYQFGTGVSKDLPRAYKLFLRAAKADSPEGQYFLAFLIATGQGTAKNSKQALKWFRIAKSNGFPVPSNLLSQAGVASIGKKGWRANKKSKESKLVWQIQSNLSKLGYNPGPVDGLIGKKTRIAIRSFQKENGIVIDGKPSDLLLIKIKKVYNPSHNKKH
jgi:localization factor PodJL